MNKPFQRILTELSIGISLDIIFFLLILVELLSLTHWQSIYGLTVCRWTFISSACLQVCFLIYIKPSENDFKSNRTIGLILWFVACLWVVPELQQIYINNPLDYKQADMLPVIDIMCDRWLHFKDPYLVIPEIWKGVQPIYLPALWMPFILSKVFQFDPRWITIGMLLLSLLILSLQRMHPHRSIFLYAFIFIWFDFVLHVRKEVFIYSEEGVVYAYYILLIISVIYRKLAWIGILMACILMSRYVIVFLLIAFLLNLLLSKRTDPFIKIVRPMVQTSLGMLLISGAWKHIHLFFSLPNQYLSQMKTALWKYQNLWKDSIGLAGWLTRDQIRTMHYVLEGSLIVIGIVMILMRKKINQRIFFSFLKLTAVLFYFLLILPYPYLMNTSIWISIAIYAGWPMMNESPHSDTLFYSL